jgi:tetratricopeptide (TPR) repeat protein
VVEWADSRNKISGTVIGNVIQGRDVTISLPVSTPAAVSGLPAQPVFVGRDIELAGLADALAPAGARGPVVVSAIAGLAGVGKTALAVCAARDALAAGWFPGGVLMVDLRGYDPPERRVSPAAALASLLGAIGTPIEHIPSDQADRERLWRSLLAHRSHTGEHVLVVLDNASSAGQVRPLLPAAGGHRVLVTSRHTLADLDGARLFEVEVLSTEHAVELLQQELVAAHPEDGRVHADSAAAGRLARLCGRLPLAIRIAAALLATDPDQPIAELTDALTAENDRLEELDYDGSLTVRAAFDLSYQHLPRGPAQLFRLLALNPGPEISTEAAAALCDHGTAQTRRMLGHLRRAHLVQPGNVRGRWRMHDLLRLYAAEQPAPDRDHALDRLLRHYVSHTQDAGRYLDIRAATPERRTLFRTRKDAVDWLDLEHPTLVGATMLAYDTEQYRHTVDLANAMYEFFWLRSHISDWIAAYELALAAARNLEDRRAESRLVHRLGFAFWRNRQYSEAAIHHLEALMIFRDLDDRGGEADALRGIGAAERGMDHPRLAENFYQQALARYRTLGDRFGEAKAIYGIGLSYATMETSSRDQAAVHYQMSQQIFRELGDRDGEAGTLGNLGKHYADLRNWDAAIECHHQALLIRQELDDRHGQADQLHNLGVAYQETARWQEATDHQRRAVELYRECGDKHGEACSLHSLGMSYRQHGLLDQAVNCYREALDLRRDQR